MSLLDDVLACVRFFSRLPVPDRPRPALAPAAAMAPVAGALVAVPAAAVLASASALRLSAAVAATLAIAALAATTGALHEDGVADCADGFGGGATRDRKLEIMRDSRIGTFGAVALVLSLLLRILALAAATAPGLVAGVAALLVAANVSRAACLLPLALLPPARTEGLGAGARVDMARVAAAVAIAAGLAAGIGLATAGGAVALTAWGLAQIAALAVCALAWRQIGGQTGDVAGFAQQAAEAAALLAFAAGGST